MADNATAQAGLLLGRAMTALIEVTVALTTTPTSKERAALRRRLSGVVADVETLRLAIKE